jgi:hypothetical protein
VKPAAPSRSVVRGHRRCARCHYQLAGQPIIREPHHELFIVRCPECATVASILEQPLPRRLADRLPLVMAAVWFAIVTGAWLVGGLAVWGISHATAQVASEPYMAQLRGWYEEDTGRDLSGGQVVIRNGVVTQTPAGPGGVSFGKWWSEQDRAACLASVGGWRGAVRPVALLMLVPSTILGFAIGLFWAIVLTRRGPWSRLLLVPMILAPAVIGSPTYIETILLEDAAWVRAAALQEVGTPALLVTLIYIAAVVAVTMAVGRAVGRRLLRWTVPASLRVAFAELWLCDGLDAPG